MCNAHEECDTPIISSQEKEELYTMVDDSESDQRSNSSLDEEVVSNSKFLLVLDNWITFKMER